MAQEIDQTTEDKIKVAARKVFTEKGYDGARTRDIAREAGINIALLNYYFRSKEKLFHIIMMETLSAFMDGISSIFNHPEKNVKEKVELLAERYTVNLLKNPDLPLFILNELKRDPKSLFENLHMRDKIRDSYFLVQLNELTGNQARSINLFISLVGMIVFPFIASPMLKEITQMNDNQYADFLLSRKQFIVDAFMVMV